MVYVLDPISGDFADFPPRHRFELKGCAPTQEFYRKKRLGLPIAETDLPTVPLDGDFAIPEFFLITMDFTIVSTDVRRALESHAPGNVKFHRLPFEISDRMQARSQYFYPEVVAREQRLDWQKTPLEPISERQPDGTAKTLMPGYIYAAPRGQQVYAPRAPYLKSIVFRSGAIDGKIWCEVDVETEEKYYTIPKTYEFLSDSLWENVNRDFPGNLRPRKLQTGSPLN